MLGVSELLTFLPRDFLTVANKSCVILLRFEKKEKNCVQFVLWFITICYNFDEKNKKFRKNPESLASNYRASGL